MGSIIINGQEILPGENRQVVLNEYPLPTKTAVQIPVSVFRSKEEGPVLFLQAGMHGDEINGIEIIRKLITRSDVTNPIKGTIIAIPIINIVSFLFGSRELPDGRDLNRCFPGSKNGSLGSRIAYDLMKEIIPQIDYGIDFHTGGSKISNYPQIRCVFDVHKNLELSEAFSAPLIINSPFRDNTLRKEASKKGKSILVFEGGESSRFDYEAINEGINGCLRLMKYLGIIDAKLPESVSVKIDKTTWVRAKHSGLFHCSKSNGTFVSKGELVGMLCNPYGAIEQKLMSPVDGYILGINNMPVIRQGDALIHIGIELE